MSPLGCDNQAGLERKQRSPRPNPLRKKPNTIGLGAEFSSCLYCRTARFEPAKNRQQPDPSLCISLAFLPVFRDPTASHPQRASSVLRRIWVANPLIKRLLPGFTSLASISNSLPSVAQIFPKTQRDGATTNASAPASASAGSAPKRLTANERPTPPSTPTFLPRGCKRA